MSSKKSEPMFTLNIDKTLYRILGFGFAGIFFMIALLGITTSHEDCGTLNPNDSSATKIYKNSCMKWNYDNQVILPIITISMGTSIVIIVLIRTLVNTSNQVEAKESKHD